METKKYKKYNFDAEYDAKGYPKSVWPLLNDYFSRAASEFELSDKEVRGKLDTLLANLNTIVIDDRPDSNNNALYCPSVKRITLNFAGMSTRNDTADAHICALFHELGHADENLLAKPNNSFMYFNDRGTLSGVCFNEIHKEMRAARLSMGVEDPASSNDPRLSTKHVGYNDLMFIGTMFHTALGISEKEFLTIAEKGPEHFRETMSKKFDDPKLFDEFYKSITVASDTIHALKYSRRELTAEDYQNIAEQTAVIYDECLIAMEARLAKDLQDGKVTPDEFAEKSKFEMDRLAANYSHGIAKNTPFSLEELNELEGIEVTQEKVLAFEAAIANRKALGKKDFTALVSELSTLGVDVDDTLDKYGLMLPSVSEATETSLDEYKREFLEEDYGENKWDNTDLISAIHEMERDPSIPHNGNRTVSLPSKSNRMDKLKELNTEEEVTNYDARMAASNAEPEIEVDIKVKTESPEL